MKRDAIKLGQDGISLEAREVPAGLDPTFGNNGTSIFGDDNSSSPTVYQSTADGRILTVTSNYMSDDGNAAGKLSIMRLLENGQRDTSYTGTGKMGLDAILKSKRSQQSQNNPTGFYSVLNDSLVAAPGGKWYLVVNYVQYEQFSTRPEPHNGAADLSIPTTPTIYTRQILRLNNDGTLDTTFADGGVATTELPFTDVSHSTEYGVTTGPDGSIYLLRSNLNYPVTLPAANSTTSGTATRFDERVSIAGMTASSTESTQIANPILFPDMRPLPIDAVFTVTKLRPDGTVDTSFGTNGSKEINSGLKVSAFSSFTPNVQVLANGSMILSGLASMTIDEQETMQAYIVKINADGSRDTSYGTNGQVVWPTIAGLTERMLNPSLNGRGTSPPVFIGHAGAPTSTSLPPRYLPENVAEFVTPSINYMSTLRPQADGTVLGVLSADPYFNDGMGKAYAFRVLANGQLDRNFGGDGLVEITSNYFLSTSYNTIGQVELMNAPGGGYLLAGNTAAGYAFQKLTATGATDTSFGRGGLAVLSAPFYIYGPPYNQTPNKPSGGAYGRFQFDSEDRLLIGGYLDKNFGTPSSNPVFQAFFTRIDLDAPTPELPSAPTPTPLTISDPITEQLGGSSFGELSADFDGDGTLDTIRYERNRVGGVESRLSIISGATGKVIVSNFRPYEESYMGGLVLAAGDVDGDGKAELVVSPDVGGAARIQVFKLEAGNLRQVENFFGIEDVDFRGGARVAVSDLNGDGKADLIVSAGPGGGPRIAVYDGATMGLVADPRKLMADFFAYSGLDNINLRNGVNIATADVNGDNVGDLVIGAGQGGGPRLTVLNGAVLGKDGFEKARSTPLEDTFLGDDTSSRDGIAIFQNPNSLDELVIVNRANNTRFNRG
ncbi:MAG: FG-GAP-like repeat-containing protein [Fimbriiglobus sp.]